MTKKTTERRRGEELESALLKAAWDELLEKGYGGLTMEAVAKRAGTSRPVLYRRWASRPDLAVAAMRYHVEANPIIVPDLGDLRDDVIALLQHIVDRRSRMGSLISVELTDYFRETNSSPAELKRQIVSRDQHTMEILLTRATARGEIEDQAIAPRIVSLPVDLLRQDMMMTMKPTSDAVIIDIVDTVFLPLVGYHAVKAG
ncbi:TetR/AcrR family transcriptional regulator [Martelella alba]|uniref:TetR/AcrR family transcriptional regulator n=1 Tax=Martelella alba TaxID=2590451 RepID=A0A506UG81_9HYPH|nr:TetR/AcrR family transcriptional regulator [Martelella alba]TPW30997.1 TetR/AcrR family transcriptional regulator [Martelella alba]